MFKLRSQVGLHRASDNPEARLQRLQERAFMTTKRPFIPLLSLVLLLAAGGGTLLALTSDNHSNTIDAASTEPGSASLEEPTGVNSTEQPVASSPTEPQPETQRSAQQAQTPQRSPSQTQSPQAPPQAGYGSHRHSRGAGRPHHPQHHAPGFSRSVRGAAAHRYHRAGR